LLPSTARTSTFGPYGTKASRIEYDRLITEWLVAGRPSRMPSKLTDMTIVELAAAFEPAVHDERQAAVPMW
jgi:hypothetical protein